MINPIVLIIGTRPEAIKMIPVYFALQRAQLPVVVCSTSQHTNLLHEVFSLFNITPDIDLSVMVPGQDLAHITTQVLTKTQALFKQIKPSMVMVQGDTTSTMAAAMAAFYEHIPVCHVEAGLRTSSIISPYPEEMNRRYISMVASIHCAPTSLAYANLLAENIDRSSIYLTGNTVVDALRIIGEKINDNHVQIDHIIKNLIQEIKWMGKKLVLVTTHRRESFNGGIDEILSAIKEFALKHENIQFFYPFHPNPNVIEAIERTEIRNVSNIFLSKPLLYKDLVYILSHADVVATDSGGICEEAVSMNKPVLILRNETERIESIWCGLATLTGTNRSMIINKLQSFLTQGQNVVHTDNVYGDGFAGEKTILALEDFFSKKNDNQFYSPTAHRSVVYQARKA
jgi:UDP-N-acetylglucosamine 2-epimerase (non-hydrolysing)